MEWLKQFARLFGWKNQQFETLTEVNVGGYKIRVWRTQPSLAEAMAFDHKKYADAIRAEIAHWPGSVLALQAQLMTWPNIACVAIVNEAGNGVSTYPDWH